MRSTSMTSHFITPPREELHWIAWDLDGTLARSVRNRDGSHSRAIGCPIKRNIDRVRDYASRGWTNVIFTARPWSDVELIRQWVELYELPIEQIIPGKLLFRWLIDDRAVIEGDWNFDPGFPGE